MASRGVRRLYGSLPGLGIDVVAIAAIVAIAATPDGGGY